MKSNDVSVSVVFLPGDWPLLLFQSAFVITLAFPVLS